MSPLEWAAVETPAAHIVPGIVCGIYSRNDDDDDDDQNDNTKHKYNMHTLFSSPALPSIHMLTTVYCVARVIY